MIDVLEMNLVRQEHDGLDKNSGGVVKILVEEGQDVEEDQRRALCL